MKLPDGENQADNVTVLSQDVGTFATDPASVDESLYTLGVETDEEIRRVNIPEIVESKQYNPCGPHQIPFG
ncbi:MAG TPA: hypothetical protein ENG98_00690 [Actinobacteria bacterium]|nr:hypothetical protein [Actinomycetota bacterium]